MPLPMLHLAVAQELLKKTTINSKEDFFVGNIAPDAIHMRNGANAEDKNNTHLHCKDCTSIEALKEKMLTFYKSEKKRNDSNKHTAFLAGYFSHLITDYYWFKTVFCDFKLKVPTPINDENLRELYYAETDLIDSKIFHWSDWVDSVWLALSQSGKNSNSLLNEEEISKWNERIINWYPDDRFDPNTSLKYFEYDSIHDFIRETSKSIEVILKEIYG